MAQAKVTGLSGHEIFCLNKIGCEAGNILVGNSVQSLWAIRSLTSSFKAVVGWELASVTELIEGWRKAAYARIEAELLSHGAQWVTGVSSEIIFQGSNIEFLSIGSSVYLKNHSWAEWEHFSTSSNAQEFYAQLDAGYKPKRFVFWNVAYSIGVARGILGSLKSLVRWEIKEFSNIFNKTRHLALERIKQAALSHQANSVIGIETTILPVGGMNGVQEMLMLWTASQNDKLGTKEGEVVTSDLTAQEMWWLANMGYVPVQLVLGTSVYSLGLIGSISSFFKSFVRGEISELTKMVYDAREQSLAVLRQQADEVGADEVVGAKTYIYQLWWGLLEFLTIGTAVRKLEWTTTRSDTLIPQAIISDKDTFINTVDSNTVGVSLNNGAGVGGNKAKSIGLIGGIIFFIYIVISIIIAVVGK